MAAVMRPSTSRAWLTVNVAHMIVVVRAPGLKGSKTVTASNLLEADIQSHDLNGKPTAMRSSAPETRKAKS
jgi:hypothetical protein